MGIYLGVDIGASWTRALLVGEGGRVLRRVKIKTGVNPAADVASAVASWEFDAIGVGSIGPLDLRSGWVVNSPNSPARRFPLVEPFMALGRPVTVANDCVAAAWGEYLYVHRVDNLVYLTLSTGVGVGAVVNGVLILGKDGNAHELGHAVIDFKSDRKCGCGGVGHLESYVGGAHIPKLYAEFAGRELTPEEIFARFREGDMKAREFVDMWLDAVAAGVATITAAYDPEVLVIGGSIALANWDLIERELPVRLGKYLGVRPPAIAKAAFGDDEVAIGAAALAQNTPETLRKFGYPRR